jgi:hypothetical protein
VNATDVAGRHGIVSKLQSSEFGLLLVDGKLEFLVHLDGKYATARSEAAVVQPRTWHHVAGVFDGQELRAYVDGKLVGRAPGAGKRTHNDLPLLIGADPDGPGRRTSFVDGSLDDVLISTGARYAGDSFEVPAALPPAQAATVLRLSFDQESGTSLPWCLDSSGRGAHPRRFAPASVQR